MAMRYSFRDVDSFLESEISSLEQHAETLASRLSAMADNDPHRAAITELWQHYESWIDAVAMIRLHFREHDRLRQYDASHDLKGAGKP